MPRHSKKLFFRSIILAKNYSFARVSRVEKKCDKRVHFFVHDYAIYSPILWGGTKKSWTPSLCLWRKPQSWIGWDRPPGWTRLVLTWWHSLQATGKGYREVLGNRLDQCFRTTFTWLLEPSIGQAMGSGGTRKGVMGQGFVSTKSICIGRGIFFQKFSTPCVKSDFGGIIMCFTRPKGGEKI